jgi:hypothetical protein
MVLLKYHIYIKQRNVYVYGKDNAHQICHIFLFVYLLFVKHNVFQNSCKQTYQPMITGIYRVIEKSRNPFLTQVLFVKKKLHWNQKTKEKTMLYSTNIYYTNFWKCPPRSAMRAFKRFLMFDASLWRVSALTETVHQTRYKFFGTGELGNISLNWFWLVK